MKRNTWKAFRARTGKSNEEDDTYMPLPAKNSSKTSGRMPRPTLQQLAVDNDYYNLTGDISNGESATRREYDKGDEYIYESPDDLIMPVSRETNEKKPQENVYNWDLYVAPKQQTSAGQLAAGQQASKSASTTQTCVCVYKRTAQPKSQLLVDNRKEERHPTTGHYDHWCEYRVISPKADRPTSRTGENTGVEQGANEAENDTEPECDRHDDDDNGHDVYYRQSYCSSGGMCIERRQDVFKSTMVVPPATVIQSSPATPAILPVSVPTPLPLAYSAALATPAIQTTDRNPSAEVKMATVLVMVKLISAGCCVCVDVLVLMACNSQKLKDFMEPHVQKGYVTATTLECQLFRNKGNVRADVKDIFWMKDKHTPGVVLESSVDNLWADAVLSNSFPVTSADAALSNGAFNSLFTCKISVQQDDHNLQTATITCDLHQYKTPGKTTRFVNCRCDDCAGERSSEKFSKRRSKVTSRLPPSREVPVSTSSSESRWPVSGPDSSGPFDFQSEYSSMSAAARDKLKLADSSSGPQCNVCTEVSPEHRSPVTWV